MYEGPEGEYEGENVGDLVRNILLVVVGNAVGLIYVTDLKFSHN